MHDVSPHVIVYRVPTILYLNIRILFRFTIQKFCKYVILNRYIGNNYIQLYKYTNIIINKVL